MEKFELRLSPYWRDIEPILTSGPKRTRFDVRILLHTPDEDINVLSVSNLDVRADYVANVGDEILAVVTMGLGDYAKRVYPHRAMLEATVKLVYKYAADGKAGERVEEVSTRYRAYFDDTKNLVAEASHYESYDIQTLNNQRIESVYLQLMDRGLEVLRIRTVEGTFRNIEVEKLVPSIMVSESLKVEVDGKPAVDLFDMVEPRNRAIQPTIVIPRIKISDFPSYIQEKVCGVYQHAIGTYMTTYRGRRTWFVYPLYDHARFDSGRPRVVFYSINPREFPNVDRTYREEGDVVSVLVNEVKGYSDSADNDNLNQGQGFRLADPKAITRKPVKMTEKGPVAERTRMNREVGHKGRQDGVNYAPDATRGNSSNPYVDYSKIMMRASGRIDLVWEHGDPRLLYPGMPCRYYFLEKGQPVYVDGTVLFAHQVMNPEGNPYHAENFTTRTGITIGVTPRTVNPGKQTQETYGRF